MWHKIKRYQQNLKSETDPNIRRDMKAIISGMVNFYTGSKKWTDKAIERLEDHCSDCEFFRDDPVFSEHVADKDVLGLSGKMCGNCGCTLSYKLRQSIKPCEFWNEGKGNH